MTHILFVCPREGLSLRLVAATRHLVNAKLNILSNKFILLQEMLQKWR